MAINYRTLPNLPEQTIKRFWSHVDKTPGQGPQGTCWEWKVFRTVQGYGKFGLGHSNGMVRAHRLAYFLSRGVDPVGLLVCHKCDNPPCCNPDHLWAGTSKENLQDMVKKGRALEGDRNPTRRYPERVPKGDDHYTRVRLRSRSTIDAEVIE